MLRFLEKGKTNLSLPWTELSTLTVSHDIADYFDFAGNINKIQTEHPSLTPAAITSAMRGNKSGRMKAPWFDV